MCSHGANRPCGRAVGLQTERNKAMTSFMVKRKPLSVATESGRSRWRFTTSRMTSAMSGALIVTLTSSYPLCESIDDDEKQIIAVAFPIGGNRQSRDKIYGQDTWVDPSSNDSTPVTIGGSRGLVSDGLRREANVTTWI